MARTDPDVLALLRRGGIALVYWRRKRETAKWHRGMRMGTIETRSQCGRLAAADGGRLIFGSIEEPWPSPRCRQCEVATPGTDAAHATLLDPSDPRFEP